MRGVHELAEAQVIGQRGVGRVAEDVPARGDDDGELRGGQLEALQEAARSLSE